MWAIKHSPSGKYLPAPRGRNGRGGTHVEIDDAGMPRLFASKAAARAALRWWLRGAVTVGQTESWSPSYGVDYDEDWRTVPKPHRNSGDMRVVKVAIIEVEG